VQLLTGNGINQAMKATPPISRARRSRGLFSDFPPSNPMRIEKDARYAADRLHKLTAKKPPAFFEKFVLLK
jgi:hypothetical protein